jgi:very-short-patch-repair endonuclease
MIKKLLSLNYDDVENIWDAYNVMQQENKKLVPFASDPGGNFICFNKDSGEIYLWLHETNTAEYVAESFKDFLDKLGIVYQTQFKAESIGRYYDFYCPASNTLLEIDGDYYHSYGLLYEQMSPMQKKNKRVDEQKDKWAREHNINLIRIWEHDINKNPSKVLNMLKEKLSEYSLKYQKEQEKKQRPKKP